MFKKVLLLYKKSAYKIYFLERKGSIKRIDKKIIADQINKFKRAHQEHYRTLKTVTQELIEHEIDFTENFRGQRINYDKYDLIITVGGDGTFLEAARNVKDQAVMGVNSAPSYSTGSFCIANAKSFKTVIGRIVRNKYTTKPLHRIRLKCDTLPKPVDVLNDALVSHENPAMMSRYIIKQGRITEEQRSSGVWVATAAGSTGAIHSAGGKKLQKDLKKFQFIPRELYPRRKNNYKLKGGVLSSREKIEFISLMRKGVIYVDGAHIKIPFEYGSALSVHISPKPIKTIALK